MITKATKNDAAAIAQLAVQMWSSHPAHQLQAEFEELLARDDAAIFLCVCDGRIIGFAQCQLRRDYVEGTESSPVGYLEGVFVETQMRGRGYGKAMVSACEQWAKTQGCKEFASDCELSNHSSLAFHLHAGFQEANRIICFVKKIQ